MPSKSIRELKFICTPSSHLMYTWQRSSQIHLRDSQLRVIFRKAALEMRQYKQQVKKNSNHYVSKNLSKQFCPRYCHLLITLSSWLPSQPKKHTWVFPKLGVPQNGWFIMENPIKMDDLGVSPIFGNIHIRIASHFTSCWGLVVCSLHLPPSYQIWWSRWSYWNSRSSTLCRPSRCPENKSRGFPQSWKGEKM